jgi:hypothetical protein
VPTAGPGRCPTACSTPSASAIRRLPTNGGHWQIDKPGTEARPSNLSHIREDICSLRRIVTYSGRFLPAGAAGIPVGIPKK